MIGEMIVYLQRFIKFIGRIRPRPKLRKRYRSLITNKKQIILLDVPTNGNIGDQAIVYATEKFLKDIFMNYSILEVPYTDLNAVLITLKRRLSHKSLVILNGGGNIGDIYPSEEFNRWTTYRLLNKNNKILFPQSISFKSIPGGNKILIDSVKNYHNANDLIVFLREKSSFDFFKKNYNDVKSQLVPDIVFYLEKVINNTELSSSKIGCISLLRNDIEKGNYDISRVYEILATKSINIQDSDTYISDIYVDNSNREKIVLDKIMEISRYKLVITDRLHGMILAYLAHTPAIVIENNNWKIRSTYETWLKDVPYIEIVNSNPSRKYAEEIVNRVLGASTDYVQVSSSLNSLRETVRDNMHE